jgi:hypothetical protein
MLCRHGATVYLISAVLGKEERLGVVALPLTPRQLLGRLRSKLRTR